MRQSLAPGPFLAVIGWLILSGVAIALWRYAAPGTERADALT
jgi:hypothetical protein